MAKKQKPKTKQEYLEIESAYRDIAPRAQTKKHSGAAAIVTLCSVIIVLAIVIVGGFIYYTNVYLNGVIIDNVTVAGIDVGGMTVSQAESVVNVATNNTFSNKAMTVSVFESQVELPADCVDNFNVRRAVLKAYSLGRLGSSAKKQADLQAALAEGIIIDLAPYLDVDEELIRSAIAPLGEKYSTTLSQSKYSVEKNEDGDYLCIEIGIPEYRLDLDDLYKQIMHTYSLNQFELSYTCSLVEPDALDLNSINEEFYVAPIDAKLDPNTYEVIPSVDGYGFDIEALQKRIDEASFGQTVKIPFTSIAPEMTTEELQALLFRDKLSTYTATSSSNYDRNINLDLACKAIDGLILNPGEVFSYNEALGERTPEKGYRPGASYSGGETVITYGGGICQVSSSLYYCVMHADLEVVLREEHGYVSSYVPMGMDATVSWGTLDFQFRNNMDYPIKIEASAYLGSVTVSLYGTDERDYYVDIEYVVTGTNPYETVYKTFEEDNKEGYKDGDVIITPYTGYTAETYRCKYSKATKELISKEFEAKSVYGKRDKVICKIENASETTAPDAEVPTEGIGGNGGISDDGALPPE